MKTTTILPVLMLVVFVFGQLPLPVNAQVAGTPAATETTSSPSLM